jgi:integrase
MQKFIIASRTGRRRLANGRKLTKGTIANYKCCLKLLQEFENKTGDTIKIFTGFRLSKQVFTQQRKCWQQFAYSWSDFLYNKGYYDNYVSNQFKMLRTLLNYLHKEKGWMVNQFIPGRFIPKEQIPIVVLTPQQLNFLINDVNFHNSLSPCLQRAKDIFVTGCTVALRISDLQKLTQKNLEECDGKFYLTVYSGKTQTYTRVLLPLYVMNIFKRNVKRCKRLLPPLSNTNLNIQIKKLAEKAGWTHTVVKQRKQRSIAKIQYVDKSNKTLHRFCDLITTHTMRRTAISAMLALGMPEYLVRKVSGHAPGSREFYRYVNLNQQYLDTETERVFNLLSEHK